MLHNFVSHLTKTMPETPITRPHRNGRIVLGIPAPGARIDSYLCLSQVDGCAFAAAGEKSQVRHM
jgi:hypothetical protein